MSVSIVVYIVLLLVALVIYKRLFKRPEPPKADPIKKEITAAAKDKNLEKVKELIAENPKLEQECGTVLLCISSSNNDILMLKYLLTLPIDVNASCFLSTPLNAAAKIGSMEAVKILVSFGANVNGDGYNTPLGATLPNDQFEVFKYLVEKGANINQDVGEFKISLLDAARIHQAINIEAYLLRVGVSSRIKHRDKFQPEKPTFELFTQLLSESINKSLDDFIIRNDNRVLLGYALWSTDDVASFSYSINNSISSEKEDSYWDCSEWGFDSDLSVFDKPNDVLELLQETVNEDEYNNFRKQVFYCALEALHRVKKDRSFSDEVSDPFIQVCILDTEYPQLNLEAIEHLNCSETVKLYNKKFNHRAQKT